MVYSFKKFNWKLDIKALKDIKKSIIIEAPHTSNWDFIIGIIAAKISKITFYFLIKNEWNKPIIGSILTKLGAIFIDRSQPNGITQQISNKLNTMDNGHIIFTPEGTRGKVNRWKTGFYYIAHQLKLPIAVAYIDYEKKKVGIDHIMYTTGDIKRDSQKLNMFYKNITPKNKENFNKNWTI